MTNSTYSTRLAVGAAAMTLLLTAAPIAHAQRHHGGNRGGARGSVVVRTAPAIVSPRAGYPIRVAPMRFYQPYYVFQPRTNFGVGLSFGFPVTYSRPFFSPFVYPYYPGYTLPYSTFPAPTYTYPAYPSYGYPTAPASSYPVYSGPGTVTVQRSQPNTGGVSFEITPDSAELLVDGVSYGAADQFTPTTQPLGLTPGRHRFEVRAAGYQTMTFDADIVAGQVLPLQVRMEH